MEEFKNLSIFISRDLAGKNKYVLLYRVVVDEEKWVLVGLFIHVKFLFFLVDFLQFLNCVDFLQPTAKEILQHLLGLNFLA